MLARWKYALAGLALFAADLSAIEYARPQAGGGAAGGGQQAAVGAFGGVPTLSSCGTSPSATGNSNSFYGTINEGTGSPTGCTLTWTNAAGVATARQQTPTCLVTGRTASYLVTAITAVNTTTLTWTNAGSTSGVYDYVCFGS